MLVSAWVPHFWDLLRWVSMEVRSLRCWSMVLGSFWAWRLEASATLPLAEGLDVLGGAVAEPGVELGGVFELLAARSRDDDEF